MSVFILIYSLLEFYVAAKEFFSLYPEYARNLHGIIRLLSEESEKNPKFKSLMQVRVFIHSSHPLFIVFQHH